MRKLIPFLICFLALSCNNQNRNKIEKTEVKCDENFYYFFANFIYTQEFQVNRTKIANWTFKDIHPEKEYKLEIGKILKDNLDNEDKDIITEKHLTSISFKDSLITDYIFNKIDCKWYLTEVSNIKLNDYKNKTFISFLSSFSSDSVFRKNHIKLPLKYGYLNEDDFSKQEKYLNETEIPQYNYFGKGDFIFLNNGNVFGNKLIITINGISNGIYTFSCFELINGEWTLVEDYDYST